MKDLLRIEDLHVSIGKVRAVNGVPHAVEAGEVLGAVGEIGCGTTTAGRSLLRVQEPASGTVTVDGVDFGGLRSARLREIRRRMQMVFQDPAAALNPRHTVEELIAEPLRVEGRLNRAEIATRVAELKELVGLPAQMRSRFPHEFSGGQKQRIGIARALALAPDLIVCGEAIASLDVSVQAQIVNLMKDLQARLGVGVPVHRA